MSVNRKLYRMVSFALLCCYMLFVLVRVVLVRNTHEEYRFKLQLFWSYSVEGGTWENLLNVVLFIPVGFLLYQSFKKIQLWAIVFAGFIFSVSIELMQLGFRKGFCEVDDVVHNTFGCIVGLCLSWLLKKRPDMTIVERLNKRFWQFGGWRLMREYVRHGALGGFVKEGWQVLCGKKKIEDAYARIQRAVIPYIRNEYTPYLESLVKEYAQQELQHEHSGIVWVCWLQGMEQAPEIIRICHASLHRHLKGREIVVITEKNISEYVTFPEHIQRKYQKGVIPMAQYSDLLRLELLTRYGGTWIDATVLCTGFGHTENTENAERFLDADLFLFQSLKKGDSRVLGISNWFITASSNQKVLLILRDLLYKYWEDYDCVVAYFIFHIFLMMIVERLPDEVAKMPRKSNKFCFYLEHRLGDEYDEQWMYELTSRCCFHKLNGRLWKEAEGKGNTFRKKIIDTFGLQ